MLAKIALYVDWRISASFSREYTAVLNDSTTFTAHAHKTQVTFREGDKYVEETIDLEIIDTNTDDKEEFSIDSRSEDDI